MEFFTFSTQDISDIIGQTVDEGKAHIKLLQHLECAKTFTKHFLDAASSTFEHLL